MLSEETVVPVSALPVQALKDHLRLGTGFSDDGLQDALIQGYIRAAIAAIEGRIGKVLILRRFRWILERWRWSDQQTLPVAPVSDNRVGGADQCGRRIQPGRPCRYRLVEDMHRPRLQSAGTALPSIRRRAGGDTVQCRVGPAWGNVPADLQQAVMLARRRVSRTSPRVRDAGSALPFGILALIERWRTVRIIGGGGA